MNTYLKLAAILLVFTTVVYHLVDYQNFPLSPHYNFPFSEILIAYLTALPVIIIIERYHQFLSAQVDSPQHRIKRFLIPIIPLAIINFIIAYFLFNIPWDLYYLISSFILTLTGLIAWITIMYGRNLLKWWSQSNNNDSLLIKSGHKLRPVNYDTLVYFDTVNKIVIAHLASEKQIVTNFNLKELEELLPERFFRINRQVIVNKYFISEVKPGKNQKLEIQMENQSPDNILTVSRYRAAEFRKWLKH